MDFLLTPEIIIALLSLIILEIVLGIDNLVFISILVSRLPKSEQSKARNIGLFLAMFMRVGLLFCLTWIMKLSEPVFTIMMNQISGRDIILILGGIFLIFKSTREIHHHIENEDNEQQTKEGVFFSIILQIILLDIIFSLDSVITAIGLAGDQLYIMVTAIIVAIIFMLIFIGSISRFIDEHPTVKILALSFLLLIGMALIGDGLDMHIPKEYIYFAMGFSIFVELINMKSNKK